MDLIRHKSYFTKLHQSGKSQREVVLLSQLGTMSCKLTLTRM